MIIKKHRHLLLLFDASEAMIDRYLERGEMLDDDGAECVVINEDVGIYELKNIAVMPGYCQKGYGRKRIKYLFNYYTDGNVIGDSYLSLSFYKSCRFKEFYRVKNFFVDNYDYLMFEDGV